MRSTIPEAGRAALWNAASVKTSNTLSVMMIHAIMLDMAFQRVNWHRIRSQGPRERLDSSLREAAAESRAASSHVKSPCEDVLTKYVMIDSLS